MEYMDSTSVSGSALHTAEHLQELWRQLNDRYFRSALLAIDIHWSDRLTSSAGMFVCRVGPRHPDRGLSRRVIKLSAHLLASQPAQEIVETLAHEMIHQWGTSPSYRSFSLAPPRGERGG